MPGRLRAWSAAAIGTAGALAAPVAIRPASMATRLVVVPLSRPFGSIVMDARVDCEDGLFYRPDAEVDFINTKDSTGPLDVGGLGEVYYDARHCNGAWSKITLTPRFPEWRCSGCQAYEPAP